MATPAAPPRSAPSSPAARSTIRSKLSRARERRSAPSRRPVRHRPRPRAALRSTAQGLPPLRPRATRRRPRLGGHTWVLAPSSCPNPTIRSGNSDDPRAHDPLGALVRARDPSPAGGEYDDQNVAPRGATSRTASRRQVCDAVLVPRRRAGVRKSPTTHDRSSGQHFRARREDRAVVVEVAASAFVRLAAMTYSTLRVRG